MQDVIDRTAVATSQVEMLAHRVNEYLDEIDALIIDLREEAKDGE